MTAHEDEMSETRKVGGDTRSSECMRCMGEGWVEDSWPRNRPWHEEISTVRGTPCPDCNELCYGKGALPKREPKTWA